MGFRWTTFFVSAFLLAAPSAALADAELLTADIEGSADTTLVKRYDGSLIISYEHSEYTDFTAPLSPLVLVDPPARDVMNNRLWKPEKAIEAEGRLTRLVYLVPEGRSPLEVLRNYQDEVEAGGGKVLFECKKEGCGGDHTRSSSGGGSDMSLMMVFFRSEDLKDEAFSNGSCALSDTIGDQRYFTAEMPEGDGKATIAVQTYQTLDDTYCKAINGRTIAVVHILEPKAREKKMVAVKAAEMASSLETTGRVALYGILFDTDKTEVKPESDASLGEIAKLLTDDPALSVLIVGHTDNQGAYDYNLDLSQRRAKAVVAALVADHGVDAARLQPAGAGMMAPVASNADAAGQAKNRRVEVVKLK